MERIPRTNHGVFKSKFSPMAMQDRIHIYLFNLGVKNDVRIINS